MWPSIVYPPAQLARSLLGARVWARARPLGDDERADYAESAASLPPPARREHSDARPS